MSMYVVARRARPDDRAARDALMRDELAACRRDAFFLFLFQEVTLQMVVLVGAVLFIFCGVSLSSCVLLLPAALTAVYMMVLFGQAMLAEKHIQEMRSELAGFVLELRAPLGLAGAAGGAAAARDADLLSAPYTVERAEDLLPEHAKILPAQLVGSLSLAELHGGAGGGWLHALAFREGWACSAAARALLGAGAAWARGAGLARLEAALAADLQPHARQLLHDHSWQLAGSYHRRLLGGCVTLAIVHYALDLPHA